MLLRAYLLTCISLWFMTVSCQKRGEDAIYLVPENFEGNLVIFFEQERGKDTVYEGEKRLYRFDTTGILRTKFKPNYGLQQNYYFYIDSLGKRVPLQYIVPLQLDSSEKIVAYNLETGKYFDKAVSMDKHFEMITIAKQKNISIIGNERSSIMWREIEQ